ncbi:MAG: TonB-dependent receptor, partial [Rhizomicrobium sp.]
VYTYAYINKTVSATSTEQTMAEITAGVTDGLGTKVSGTKYASDIPGYTKLNAYRVWGNILRISKDYDYGLVRGQVRLGLWTEGSATNRQRYYFDITKCFAAGCDPFDSAWNYADTNTKKGTTYNGKSGVGYLEHSGWLQYQPFVEIDIKPTSDLTITPGFKYIDWTHSISAPVISGSKPPVAYSGPDHFVTSRALPFLTANYRLGDSWSSYFQYAQGIYVPDISVFEQKGPVASFPAAETTTNYQIGTVYYADNFSFDADLYYIGVNNNYSYVSCATIGGSSGEYCALNTGKAIYKGVEGEATYSFAGLFGDAGWLDGLMLFGNGSLNSAKSDGLQLNNAPLWTAAAGLIYKWNGINFSLVDKTVGQQYLDSAHVDANGVSAGAAGYRGSAFYHLGAYSTVNLTVGYSFENFEAKIGVNNLFDDRSIVSMSINDSAPSGTSVKDLASRGSSLDQYYFQAARSVQFTLKAKL